MLAAEKVAAWLPGYDAEDCLGGDLHRDGTPKIMFQHLLYTIRKTYTKQPIDLTSKQSQLAGTNPQAYIVAHNTIHRNVRIIMLRRATAAPGKRAKGCTEK